MNIVITGANRGIGLELTRQYLARGDSVFAGVRSLSSTGELAGLATRFQEQLTIRVCDVSDHASVEQFARSIESPVQVLINNAGMRIVPDDFSAFKEDNLLRVFQVNTLGPIRVARSLLPQLHRAPGAKVVNISSGLGSISNNNGGSLGYRMSKAALNMAMRTIAEEVHTAGIIILSLSPGWVKTDMGGASAPTEVADSAAGLINVIAGAMLPDSGSFMDFQGQKIAW